MKKLLLTYGDKAVAGLIVLVCLVWLGGSAGVLIEDDGLSIEARQALEKIEKRLSSTERPTPEEFQFAGSPPPYHKIAEARLAPKVGSGVAFDPKDTATWPAVSVTDPYVASARIWYPVPPKPVMPVTPPDPTNVPVVVEVAPPSDLRADKALGQVTLSWLPGETVATDAENKPVPAVQEKVEITAWRVYRRKADEEWPNEALGAVEVGVPTLEAVAQATEDTPNRVSARVKYVDRAVDAETIYEYRVRGVGTLAKQVSGGRVDGRPVTHIVSGKPPMQMKTSDGTLVFTTMPSETLTVQTPTNVQLEFSSSISIGQPQATFIVRRWNKEAAKWEEFRASGIRPADDIVGVQKAWIGGEQKVEKLDSGFRLRSLEERTETYTKIINEFVQDPETGMLKKVEREVEQERKVKVATLEDKATGETYEVKQGEKLGAEDQMAREAAPAAEDADDTDTDTAPSTGRRRSGRRIEAEPDTGGPGTL